MKHDSLTVQNCIRFWDMLYMISLSPSELSAYNGLSIFFCRRVHSSVMTPENTELIQKSIYTLIFTLKNIEVRSYLAACLFSLLIEESESNFCANFGFLFLFSFKHGRI